MDGNINPARWPALRRGGKILGLAVVAIAATLAISSLTTGCTSSQTEAVVTRAEAVPTPSAGVLQTIRTRVAAVVKVEVQKHPAIANWVNGFAQACFGWNSASLPAPGTLQFLFGLASTYAPAEITGPASAVLQIYTQDYPAASAIQGGAGPYLTALGQGIQDGVKAASVGEAP